MLRQAAQMILGLAFLNLTIYLPKVILDIWGLFQDPKHSFT